MDRTQAAALTRSNKLELDLRKWCMEQAVSACLRNPGYTDLILLAKKIEDYVNGRVST